MSQAVNLHAVEPDVGPTPDIALVPDLIEYQGRFVELPTPAHALIQATWLIHTWTFPIAFVTPYLYIHGKGPELGKCLDPNARMTMADGSERYVREIRAGDLILGWDQTSRTPVPARVASVEAMPPKQCVEVTTRRGRKLRCTWDHPVLVRGTKRSPTHETQARREQERWVPAGALEPGDQIVMALDYGRDEKHSVDQDAWLLGAWVGDGCSSQSAAGNVRSEFTNADPDIVAGFGERFSLRKEPQQGDGKIRHGYYVRGIRSFLREYGLFGRDSRTKRIPPQVMSAGRMAAAEFLSGYFDTDGTVGKRGSSPAAELYSVNEALLEDARALLAKLGIDAQLIKKNGTYMGNPHVSWRLAVYSYGQLKRLNDVLNLRSQEKRERLAHAADAGADNRGSTYGLVKVQSVEPIGRMRTIGIEVEGVHTHVTEGLVTHNTRNADTLATLARQPGSGTAAGQRIHVLAQKINASCPTLFFDEIDRVFAGRANNPIAQLLNIGFERGACYEYQRGSTLVEWTVFCPKVLIGIQNNHLPATIWSRSIPVEMQPRKRELEPFNKYHLERDLQRLELCDRLAGFAEEFAVDVASQRPERIKALGDRQNEICEPLLQIAVVLGQEQQLRDALVRVFRSDGGEKSREQVLLARIRAAFVLAQSDQISTDELLTRLGTFYTPRTLQILLSEMGFDRSQPDIRFGNQVFKGYHRSDFEPLFDKYLDAGPKLEVFDGGGV